MIEDKNSPSERSGTTRRALFAKHGKAMVSIAGGAVIARVMRATSARASGNHSWHHPPHHHPPHHHPCFLQGTRIRTVEGERRIEDLAIGDLLPTALAGTQSIEWIGNWGYARTSRGTWPRSAQPVRIARSALAPNVPHADLYLSERHALYIDGLLVTAGSLVNGVNIVRDSADHFAELKYFHIKCPRHAVIFAEGAACETLRSVPRSEADLAAGAAPLGAECEDESCAPALFDGAASEIRSHVRSMLSPVLGPQKIDLIHARIMDNAVVS